MGLYVSTTGTDVPIPELGFTLVHPETNYPISEQFTSEEIQRASSLTSAIRAGTLVWKKTAGGSAQTPTDYDPDFVEVDEMNSGVGAKADRAVTFKDLTAATLLTKSGYKAYTDFSGNPKKATVTFGTAFPSGTTYSIEISGADIRFWTWESVTISGFVLNSNANQALTGNVHFTATAHGGDCLMGYTKNLTVEDKLKYRSRMTIPEFTTTTLNGTLYLTNTSGETQFLSGSATGFTVYLPDATTLPVTNKGGWIFNIYNMSSAAVTVKDAAGNVQLLMSQTSASPFMLQDNTTAAGIWVGWQVFANSSAGLLNYTVESSTPFSTLSTSFDPITNFSISNAVTGLYVLLLNASCTATQNNAIVQSCIYIGGVQLTESLRKVQTVSSNFVFLTATIAVHPVYLGEVVDIRVAVSQGTLTVLDRTLVMLRIGNP